MDQIRKQIVNEFLSHYTTNSPGDMRVHGEILRMYKSGDKESYIFARWLIMCHRKLWVEYIQHLQNKWQNSGRNHHTDSFELRESYVAPHVRCTDEYAFEAKARAYNHKRKPELYAEQERKMDLAMKGILE